MRLIDADKLMLELNEAQVEYDENYRGLCLAKNKVYESLTIEAELVIHAHWVTRSDYCGTFYFCSHCGEDLPRYFKTKPSHNNLYGELMSIDKTPRCPNCGAIMNENDE